MAPAIELSVPSPHMAYPTIGSFMAPVYRTFPTTFNSTGVYCKNLENGEVYGSLNPTTIRNSASVSKMLTIYAGMTLRGFTTKADLEGVTVTIVADDLTPTGNSALAASDTINLYQLMGMQMVESVNDASKAWARYFGQWAIDNAGPGTEPTDPLVRFSQVALHYAQQLGISTLDFGDAWGLDSSTNNNECSPEDWMRLMYNDGANSVLTDPAGPVWNMMLRRTWFTRINSEAKYVQVSSGITEGGFDMKGVVQVKGGFGGGTHRWVIMEMPNGQRVGVITQGAGGADLAKADIESIYDSLIRDFPGLGISPNPWTPLKWATRASADMVAHDENGAKYTDSGKTTLAGTNDPVGAWVPSYTRGATTFDWYQTVDNDRPNLRSDGGVEGDGGNEWLRSGLTSFEGMDWFATTGQAWVTGVGMNRTGGGSGTLIGAGGSSIGSRKFHLWDHSTGEQPRVVIRGDSNAIDADIANGNQNGVMFMWDGDASEPDEAGLVASSYGNRTMQPGEIGGASNQTTQELTILARTSTNPGYFYDSTIYRTIVANKRPSDDDALRMARWLAGHTINDQADPTGADPGSSVTELSITGNVQHISQVAASALTRGLGISGDVQYVAEIAATLSAGNDYTISGDVQVVKEILATALTRGRGISGDVQHVAEVLASLQLNAGRSISGDVQHVLESSSNLYRGLGISGDVQSVLEVAATIDLDRAYVIAGDVQHVMDIVGALSKTEGYSISGDVATVIVPEGGLDLNGQKGIIGDVQIVSEVVAGLAKTTARAVTGDIQITAEVLASMLRGRGISGDLQIEVQPTASTTDLTRNWSISGDVQAVIEALATIGGTNALTIAGDVQHVIEIVSTIQAVGTFVEGVDFIWVLEPQSTEWELPPELTQWTLRRKPLS